MFILKENLKIKAVIFPVNSLHTKYSTYIRPFQCPVCT